VSRSSGAVRARDALLAAGGLLTRLPLPAPRDEAAQDRAPLWFPFVGALIGVWLALAAALGEAAFGRDAGSALLVGWLVMLGWWMASGALHLDGVSDLADGLGAAHAGRDAQDRRGRMLAAMRDAHAGAFGVAAVALVVTGKLAALAALASGGFGSVAAWLLVPAWARWGALCWASWLPPLAREGMGAWLAARVAPAWCWGWGAALALLSLALAPALLWAPALVGLWGVWLQRAAGGMNGDALGAGIEVVELGLLVALVAA